MATTEQNIYFWVYTLGTTGLVVGWIIWKSINIHSRTSSGSRYFKYRRNQRPVDKQNLQVYSSIINQYKEVIHADDIDAPFLNKFYEYLHPSAKILDYGSGAGGLTAKLNNLGFEAIGADISDDFVNAGRNSYPDMALLKADSEELVSMNLKFDAIIAAYSLIHLHRLTTPFVLADFNKLLQPGGYLYLSLQTRSGYQELELGLPLLTLETRNAESPMKEVSVPYYPALKLWIKLFNPTEIRFLLNFEGFDLISVDFREPVENEFDFRKMFVTAQKR